MADARGAEKRERHARSIAMAVLARADGAQLAGLWDAAGIEAVAEALRGPEIGLVTLRGRMGGGGAAFNLGEATVTRATVRLPTGEVGHSWALGRDRDKARLAATIDALWQRPEARPAVQERIVAPLAALQAKEDARLRAETAPTRVDFFTMVRGED